MSLRDDRARMTGRTPAGAALAAPSAPVPASVAPPRSALPGIEVTTAAGVFHQVITRYELEHVHGRVRLGDLLSARTPEVLLRPHERARGLDLRRTLLLDTETTGLAGGSGTYAFLVGLAFFRDGCFEVRQLLMRDHGEEAALLGALAALLGEFDALVTYNGKSFDVPLLETRFALARQPADLRRAAHLDLLHPARRLWRGRTGDCRLSTLEREVCAFERQGDVSGAEIPGLYFSSLRRRDPSLLLPVLEHNRWDLLSLAALLGRVLGLVRDPLGTEGTGPEDLLRVARIYESQPDWKAARPLLEEAARGGGATRRPALARLGEVCRRLGDAEAAARAWEALVDEPGVLAAEPCARLARHWLARPGGAARAVAVLRAGITRAADPSSCDRLARLLARAERRAATASGLEPA
ncbi:MAG: ribonuclease H-like domain-containing protein [Planctomycetes bacterium]|nr:ribonuclease H-like domain-containing protein [Planctomycetota bacterium]